MLIPTGTFLIFDISSFIVSNVTISGSVGIFFAVIFLLFEVLGVLFVNSSAKDSTYLTSRYNYANTVKAYNLHTATWTDIIYLIFGKPSSSFSGDTEDETTLDN